MESRTVFIIQAGQQFFDFGEQLLEIAGIIHGMFFSMFGKATT